jgi:dTDP-4-dehydrorhamnose 3,5-epimerase
MPRHIACTFLARVPGAPADGEFFYVDPVGRMIDPRRVSPLSAVPGLRRGTLEGDTRRMQVISTEIADVKEIRPVRHHDPRGFFSEIFREAVLREHGIDVAFVQENLSLSLDRGVVRGLHFQIPPAGQAKLVRVGTGSILDVAVDIRAGSPSYGRHVAVVLSAALGNQLFVPEGFAHGFCTLEPNTEIIYKVSRYYSREHDLGLAWDDRRLGIAWPVSKEAAVLSDKDRRQPLLAEMPAHFRYQ